MARKRQGTLTGKDQPLTHEEDPILTLSEVGRQLGKNRRTIARWCQDGLLNALRIPGTPNIWGVRKSEVNKFLGASALYPRLLVETKEPQENGKVPSA